MTNQSSVIIRRTAAAFLVLGALACFVAAGMYSQDQGGFGRGAAFHAWEHWLFSTAVILTAVGFVVLQDAFEGTGARLLARIGTSLYFFGGVLMVAGGALALTISWDEASVLLGVYVVLAYLAQVAIGAALIRSRLTNPWIGWATIAWNLGWLLALILIGWDVGYIPILHHFMPFVIGIALLWNKT